MKLKITLFLFLQSLFFYSLNAQCDGATYEEVNGLVVIEMESANLASGWNRETGVSGFTGNSFIAWRGNDFFNAPGAAGVSEYKVRINRTGTYRFAWRNNIGVIADVNPTTEHNDSWLKIPDASSFFARRGSSILFPKGSGRTPNPEGSGGNGWFKVNANRLVWNWDAFTNDGFGHLIYARFDSPGVYTIQIAGRSNGHLIDRMVLFNESLVNFSTATSLSQPETRCGGGSPPPPPPPPGGDGNDPVVSITSPSDGQNFSQGSNITVNLTSNDPDGDIATHEIFVNNVRVDLDGPSYSPHQILNIDTGNFVIRARVTDGQGNVDESSVNISVGSGNPPPPPPPSDDDGPEVTITSPTNQQNIAVGATVSVSLSTNGSGGNIVLHQIFVNNALVDTDGTSYTPHIITNIAAGSYTIRAVVTDNQGSTAEATVDFSVGGGSPPPPPPPSGEDGPSVSITSPGNGQNFDPGSTVSVSLTANDSDGTIVQHRIFVNNMLVDTDGTIFTPHPIRNIAPGNYTIRAVVTDNDGNTAEDTISISVGSDNPPPPPPPNSSPITFTLVDAVTDADVSDLVDGQGINGSNINIRTDTDLSGVGSAELVLQGPTNRRQVENVAPYALFGDINGDYQTGPLLPGFYTLTARMFSGSGLSGSLLAQASITFNISIPNATSPGISSAQSAIAFPNPTPTGQFKVRLPDNMSGNVGYTIINATGAKLDSGVFNVGNKKELIDLSIPQFNGFNQGVYYIILKSNGLSQTIPLLKE